jgi:hypothetical protein
MLVALLRPHFFLILLRPVTAIYKMHVASSSFCGVFSRESVLQPGHVTCFSARIPKYLHHDDEHRKIGKRIKVGLPIKSASMFEKLPHTSRVQLLPDRCTCRMFAFPPSAGTGTVFEEQIETNRSGRGSHPGEDAPESGSVVRGATSEQVSPGERLRGI